MKWGTMKDNKTAEWEKEIEETKIGKRKKRSRTAMVGRRENGEKEKERK